MDASASDGATPRDAAQLPDRAPVDGAVLDLVVAADRVVVADAAPAESGSAVDAAPLDVASALDAATVDTAAADSATSLDSTGGLDSTRADAVLAVDAAAADAGIADSARGPDTALPDAGYPDLYRPDVEMPPGLVWIPVPRGSFEMGCSAGDSSCWAGEYPRHGVAVAAFEMTETEITQSQYLHVVGSNPSLNSTCADCPVERVGWQEARAFCAAVGGRLPREAEWEYAARAGTTTAWYCGAEQSCAADIAWISAPGSALASTQPVRQKTANDFGLHDMLGNVWEWVEDCLHEDYESAPSTAVVWAGGDCAYRHVRGGKFNQGAGYARSSTRGVSEVGATSEGVGLRCVR